MIEPKKHSTPGPVPGDDRADVAGQPMSSAAPYAIDGDWVRDARAAAQRILAASDSLFLVEWMPYFEAVQHVLQDAIRHSTNPEEFLALAKKQLELLKHRVVGKRRSINSAGRMDLHGEFRRLTPEDLNRLDSASVFDIRSWFDPGGLYLVF
jgi:hypothetical protein